MMACGLMRGAAIRKGDGPQGVFEALSEWTIPLYTCATSIKATIQTTSFLLNGTSGLASLTITNVRPKTYPNNESIPLWGVEESGQTNADMSPLWGLVAPDYEKYPNISVIRQESLHIPGYAPPTGSTLHGIQGQNLPATDFPSRALISTYGMNKDFGATEPRVDYTGYSNMAMYVKWQNLSRNANDAAKIVNLIWTDLAAAAVVGTKSAEGPRGASDPVRIVVRPLVNKIRYHWRFGIPAFLVALLCMIIASFATLTFIFRRHNLSKMRKHLHQTAAGRIFTSFLYPEDTNLDTSSREWSERVGKNVIDLSGDNVLMTLLAKNNFHKGNHGGGKEGIRVGENEVPMERDGFLVPRTPSPYGGHSPQLSPPPMQAPQVFRG